MRFEQFHCNNLGNLVSDGKKMNIGNRALFRRLHLSFSHCFFNSHFFPPLNRPPTFKEVSASSRTNARQLLFREQCLQQQQQERQQQQQQQQQLSLKKAKHDDPQIATASSSAIPIQKESGANSCLSHAASAVPPQVYKVIDIQLNYCSRQSFVWI